MARVSTIITQLDLLYEKAKRTSKRKISEQECRKVYDGMCLAFPEASLEERVDIHLAFEDREPLIDALLEYMSRITRRVVDLVRKDKSEEAINALCQAMIADAIMDGRAELEALQKIQNDLLNAAGELHFAVQAFLQPLETPASAYVDRAYQFQKQHNNAQAIRALGRALQLEHTLRENPKIGEFAALLTGEPAYSSVILLEDTFLRNSLIQDLERKRRFQQAKTQEAAVVRSDSAANFLQRVLNGVRGGRRS